MATLKESLAADLTGYTPVQVEPTLAKYHPPMEPDLQPKFNPMLRCPLPPVSVTPDSLRQFYLGGVVPQMRVFTPPNSLPGSGGTVIQNTTIQTTTSGSSSSSTSSIASKQASITTSVLNPNDVFSGSLLVSKSFQLLQVTASSTCRIQLYGTAMAQSIDLGRALDAAPAAGVFQNIISDVALDTAPYQWPYQNRIGANGDSPQTSLVYISITNLDIVSDVITVTISYVPLEL
jgi:hypothetical protein